MFRMIRFLFALIPALVIAATAHAAFVTDQEQPNADPALGPLAIGGFAQQKIVQTVTAGMDGPLGGIEIPVGCSSGTLIVEIVAVDADGRPTNRVLASARVPASEIPAPPEWRRIVFRPPVMMSTGDRFAILLRSEDGECSLLRGGATDAYGGGEAFFDARPNPPGWISFKETDPGLNLPFRTLIDVPDRRSEFVPCEVSGFGPVPIPSFVPLCRCLEDSSIREQRCTLLHPSLVFFRRIPLPLVPGQQFKVRWSVMPLTRLTGSVEVHDVLPPGFQSSMKGPLVFYPGQVLPGGTLTIEYDAVAGPKAANVETKIRLISGQQRQEGAIRTMMAVSPPPR